MLFTVHLYRQKEVQTRTVLAPTVVDPSSASEAELQGGTVVQLLAPRQDSRGKILRP